MRVYFEKPRTTVGWKGLISDPHLDGTNDIARGLCLAREILGTINEKGLPSASEFLDPDCSPVHVRPCGMGRHWSANDGESDAPADGQRAFHAGWFQECDRRWSPGCC